MFKKALDSLTKMEGPLSRAAALSAVSALILSAASKVSGTPSRCRVLPRLGVRAPWHVHESTQIDRSGAC